MALTANGNRTGMAAVTDKRDFQEFLYTEQRKYAAEVRRLKELKERLANKLVEVEGADMFFKWWESSEVPDGDPEKVYIHQTHIRILEARLRYVVARKFNLPN